MVTLSNIKSVFCTDQNKKKRVFLKKNKKIKKCVFNI